MRRVSVLLAVAALLLSAVVGYTYKLRLAKAKKAQVATVPAINPGLNALAPTGWSYGQDDVQGRPLVRLEAASFQSTQDPSTFDLGDLRLKLYGKDATEYTYVRSERAQFDERSGVMKSEGTVTLLINVPVNVDAEDKKEASKRVQVKTTGITYETKSGKVTTDQFASFAFTEGSGEATGADYDPSTKVLHLHSHVSLDWVGRGPVENKIHIETDDLVYKEAEQKIYLNPRAKLQRQATTIETQNAVVTLQDGVLHQADGDHAFGTDFREDRQTNYSADKMTALFDDDGNLVNIVGQSNAKVGSKQPNAQTTLRGDRADLRFAVVTEQADDGKAYSSSALHLVLADGHAVAESVPVAQPGVQMQDTRLLRSEHIELEMRPGGKDVQEIRTSSQAQLEFKPNRPDQSHRVVDASHMRLLYGPGGYVDTFLAWNAATQNEKPASAPKVKNASTGKEETPPPTKTWSDEMTTKFKPDSNQVATIEQSGNFRYEEGSRKAWAKSALLEQSLNKITLRQSARVLDATGSAVGDQIVMDQQSGDMDASGHVVSTHLPDKGQKPGTSMLDDSQPMQATADKMQTRENNTVIRYQGHAVMWQGGNRMSANEIDIDRDAQTIHAIGNVVSELVDNQSNGDSQNKNPQGGTTAASPAATAAPIFTIVTAPDLLYRDDTRIALYTGGVKLTRQKMVVTAKQLQAFLTPKDGSSANNSSLDHAYADGEVRIFSHLTADRTRTGTGEHCEYYTKDDRVVLNGGLPQIADSYKGITKGRQLTYYEQDDRLMVEGAEKQPVFTQMRTR